MGKSLRANRSQRVMFEKKGQHTALKLNVKVCPLSFLLVLPEQMRGTINTGV